MKFRITGSAYIDALLLVMLLSAGIHMIFLAGYTVITHSYGLFNYFMIINLNLLRSDIGIGTVSAILSASVYILLYAGALWILRKHR